MRKASLAGVLGVGIAVAALAWQQGTWGGAERFGQYQGVCPRGVTAEAAGSGVGLGEVTVAQYEEFVRWVRSEERRVGGGCRCRRSAHH